MRRTLWIRSLLLVFAMLAGAYASFAEVRVLVAFAPPELPVYEQPLCPGDGYIWTPGYWAWDGDDYYWVPGTWVLAPEVGFLWTPAWWGWDGGSYVFYPGYWGPQVGFYGGIAYGYGYFGHGYEGGRWENGHFFYNRSVTNINVTEIHNVYNTRVETRNENVTRVSYNGGNGGVNARPTPGEEAAARERHVPEVATQAQHVQEARANQQLRASVNHGKPPVAATARPGQFNGANVVPAREGGKYTPPANRGTAANPGNRPTSAPAAGNARPNPAVHPRDLPPSERPAAPNTGNPKLDQKYQKQQEKLYQQQEKEHQKLQEKQDQEHQKVQKQQANEAKQQQMEQKHQQQTQQMEQRHAQQQQHMQQKQPPPAPAPHTAPEPGRPH